MNMMCRPGPEKLINSVPDKVRNGCLFVKGLSVPDECPEIDFSLGCDCKIVISRMLNESEVYEIQFGELFQMLGYEELIFL